MKRGIPAVKKVLLVDDDADLLEGLCRRLQARDPGWHVATAMNGDEALALVRREHFDVVVTDILMPEKEGLETIQELRRDYPQVMIVAMSGGSERIGIDVLRVARTFGADGVLEKPFSCAELVELVDDLAPR